MRRGGVIHHRSRAEEFSQQFSQQPQQSADMCCRTAARSAHPCFVMARTAVLLAADVHLLPVEVLMRSSVQVGVSAARAAPASAARPACRHDKRQMALGLRQEVCVGGYGEGKCGGVPGCRGGGFAEGAAQAQTSLVIFNTPPASASRSALSLYFLPTSADPNHTSPPAPHPC